ncbi:MAG: hypothetical protein RL266_199 [Bacteroidota bacterium]|jgi:hypothetical protein
MRWTAVLLLPFLFPANARSQHQLQYTSDFVFKEGIYLSFQDFQNNKPVPLTYLISDLDIRSENYIDQLVLQDSIHYYDHQLEQRSIATEKVWGYCKRNRVFMAFGAKQSYNNPDFFDFYPLLNIGAISYLTATEAYYRNVTTGPQMGIGFRDPMFSEQMTVTESGQVQLLLEFRSGRVMVVGRGELRSVPPEMVSELIAEDRSLRIEFEALSIKDQKQKGMFFIRRYNERNPIYFPVSPSNY